MTQKQFTQLLGEPWKYEGKKMTFYSFNHYTQKKDKKNGIFKGFNPIIMPDGMVVVERILLADFGIKSIHYSDVVLPKYKDPLFR